MRKRRLDRALLWTLSGHRKATASLLWQGMTHLDLGMAAYELRNGRLVLLDQFLLTGERLPFRTPPKTTVAEKIAEHWDSNGAGRFTRKLFE